MSGSSLETGFSKEDPRTTERMVRLHGGRFLMGTDDSLGFPEDGEGPVRMVELSPFLMDRFAVTNADFSIFVEETGYVTETERFGWSYVFVDFLPPDLRRGAICAESARWWAKVAGAYWAAPEGPGSTIDDRDAHPVVHLTWNDAIAFASWAGKRLPTEAEWEYAARGGLEQARYPWGDELTPEGKHKCNIWQGDFPYESTGEDGFRGTAPVDSFLPNGFGLYNAVGNVWEWCMDYFAADHRTDLFRDPAGPVNGKYRAVRGGSYMCHDSYCNRYRVAARTCNTPESSGGNIGLRLAADCAQL